MKYNHFFLFLLFTSLYSCQVTKIENFNNKSTYWWMQTPTNDTLISTYWNKTLIYADSVLKSPKEVISVAILDTDFDLTHQAFDTKMFYQNPKEIVNGIDDDNNGYIDDINGWNFLGDTITGKGLTYTQMEKTRILRKYSPAQIDSLYKEKKVPYTYQGVKKSYDETVERIKTSLQWYKKSEYHYTKVMDTLRYTLNDSSITQNELESYVTNDTIIKQCINFALYYYKKGYPYEEFMTSLDFKSKSLEICMNLDYDNRELVGDKQYDLKDSIYGSPNFGMNLIELSHGTKVTGVIASAIKSFDSIKATTIKRYPIQIMPITISGVGDYLDKDMSLAIRYAVNQGAKIISISQSKSFSLNENFVDDALKFAAGNDILVIVSAGNDNIDLDQITKYPNDINSLGKKIIDNLIVVGSNNKYVNKELKRYSSNYSKKHVDIFAPGAKIETTTTNNRYLKGNGTSYSAPIVATIAAMIRSYFPKLTAKQVKQILLESGTKYDIEVEVELEDESTTLIPFSELSKSGSVVNAYQALLLAQKIANQQKN